MSNIRYDIYYNIIKRSIGLLSKMEVSDFYYLNFKVCFNFRVAHWAAPRCKKVPGTRPYQFL